MSSKNLISSLFCIIVTATLNAQSRNSAALAVIDSKFSAHEQPTVEVLRSLAKQAHIAMGVSGLMIGPEKTRISIDVEQETFKDILNQICAEDPRFSWHETRDGNISVVVGKQLPALLKVTVKTVNIGRISSTELVTIISRLPEVQEWSFRSKCQIGQVVVMGPIPEAWNFKLNETDQRLEKILNDAAVASKRYSWSAIKFSENPCVINLSP